MVYPDGATAVYDHTDAGKPLQITTPAGNVQACTVNGNGFSTSQSDWLGNITQYTYTWQNNLAAGETDYIIACQGAFLSQQTMNSATNFDVCLYIT